MKIKTKIHAGGTRCDPTGTTPGTPPAKPGPIMQLP
jgi:hypothetical protein